MAAKRAKDRPDERDQATPADREVDELAAENRLLRRKVAQLGGAVALLHELVRRSAAKSG